MNTRKACADQRRPPLGNKPWVKLVVAASGVAIACVALTQRPRAPVILDVPAAVAVDRLRGARRDVDGTGMGGLSLACSGADDRALLIVVTRAGDPRGATCRVTLRPLEPRRSDATVDCAQPGVADAAVGRLGAAMLEAIVEEHVRASATRRRYDIDDVSDRLFGLAATNRATLARVIEPPSPAIPPAGR